MLLIFFLQVLQDIFVWHADLIILDFQVEKTELKEHFANDIFEANVFKMISLKSLKVIFGNWFSWL